MNATLAVISADERNLLTFYRIATRTARAIAMTGLAESIRKPLDHERDGIRRRSREHFRRSERASLLRSVVRARRTVLGLFAEPRTAPGLKR